MGCAVHPGSFAGNGQVPEGEGAHAGGERAPPPQEPAPVFWKELYGFALILLGVWIVGVLFLAPRLARNQRARDVEERLESIVSRLAETEKKYESAISAMESDPYYRDAVYRKLLGVKRSDEILLKNPPGVSDN